MESFFGWLTFRITPLHIKKNISLATKCEEHFYMADKIDQLTYVAMRRSSIWFLLQLQSRIIPWLCNDNHYNSLLVLTYLYLLLVCVMPCSCHHLSLSRHKSLSNQTGLKSLFSSLLKRILQQVSQAATYASFPIHLNLHLSS